jgi:dTDP-4-dehydrorhamnose 3,5-epimerase
LIFKETPIAGAFVIEPERLADERGFFARTFCAEEFAKHGLEARVAQCSTSFNRRKGTLRGMHFQRPPHEECKLVRCTAGAVYDVLVDLRPGSATFRQWFGTELTADSGRAVYVPRGLAHGFLTLADDTEVLYQISEFYDPASADGVRWNDPAFGIDWPGQVRVISPRDRSYPDFVR